MSIKVLALILGVIFAVSIFTFGKRFYKLQKEASETKKLKSGCGLSGKRIKTVIKK